MKRNIFIRMFLIIIVIGLILCSLTFAFASGTVDPNDLAELENPVNHLVSVFGMVMRVIGIVLAMLAFGNLIKAMNETNGKDVTDNARLLAVSFAMIVAKPIMEAIDLASYLTI